MVANLIKPTSFLCVKKPNNGSILLNHWVLIFDICTTKYHSDSRNMSLKNNMFWWLKCIELIWTWPNEFENFNEFEMMKITLNCFPRIVPIKCKKLSRKLCINREDKGKISQFSYKSIVITRTTKFLEVLTPSYIYHGCSTRKTLW